jgi:hypothetical protein
MSNNNQSSVEYLIKEFSEILGSISTNPMQNLLLMDAMKQAKVMHKKEITEVFLARYTGTAEEYYKETFNTNQ